MAYTKKESCPMCRGPMQSIVFPRNIVFPETDYVDSDDETNTPCLQKINTLVWTFFGLFCIFLLVFLISWNVSAKN